MKQNPITRRAFALSCLAITAALGTACAQAEASVQQLLWHAFGPKDKTRYDAKTYQGDGRMVDNGKRAAAERFSLQLGEVDFAKKQTLSYKLGKLPAVSLSVGFDIRDLPPLGADNDNVQNDFNRATVHILLKTAEGKTVFEQTSPLSDWVWGGRMGGTERNVWAHKTHFTPQPEQQYVLTLKITPLAGSKAVKPAALRISGGGWKVE